MSLTQGSLIEALDSFLVDVYGNTNWYTSIHNLLMPTEVTDDNTLKNAVSHIKNFLLRYSVEEFNYERREKIAISLDIKLPNEDTFLNFSVYRTPETGDLISFHIRLNTVVKTKTGKLGASPIIYDSDKNKITLLPDERESASTEFAKALSRTYDIIIQCQEAYNRGTTPDIILQACNVPLYLLSLHALSF